MNEELRKAHFEWITDEKAQKLYDLLCDACEKRPNGMEGADQVLVADVAYLEQVKEALRDDIRERGIGKERRNGRQIYWADNKSLAHYRASAESQRKLLAELKLTPAGRKANAVEIDDDFDQFPD